MKKLLLLSLLLCGMSYAMAPEDQEDVNQDQKVVTKEGEWLGIAKDRLGMQEETLDIARERLEVEKSKLAIEEVRLALEIIQLDGNPIVKSCAKCGYAGVYQALGDCDYPSSKMMECGSCKERYLEASPFTQLQIEARKRILRHRFIN